MPEVTKHKPGSFCWVDLSTTDQDGAKQFYSKLFGWSVNDVPMGEGATYSIMQLNGRDAAALSQMQQEQRDVGIPPHWMTYIAVDSADDIAAKAKSNGAQLMMEPFDVMEHGRMAIIQDPAGAMVSIWQAKGHTGTGVVNENGALCWTELYTHDMDAAKSFYSKTFGWVAKESPEYTEYLLDETSHAGMMEIKPEWGEVPPSWNVYFQVGDCDASVEKATSMGATVLVPPMDIPNVGRFSTLQDPQGAVFSVIKLDPRG